MIFGRGADLVSAAIIDLTGLEPRTASNSHRIARLIFSGRLILFFILFSARRKRTVAATRNVIEE